MHHLFDTACRKNDTAKSTNPPKFVTLNRIESKANPSQTYSSIIVKKYEIMTEFQVGFF